MAPNIVVPRYGLVPARIAYGRGPAVDVMSALPEIYKTGLPVYKVSSVSAWPMSFLTLLMIASLEKFVNQVVLRKLDAGWQHKSLILLPLSLHHVQERFLYLLYIFP